MTPRDRDLISRLLRVADYQDREAAHRPMRDERNDLERQAATCRQAADRLRELLDGDQEDR